MIDTVILGLLKNKWTWIILIILALGTWTYTLYQDNRQLHFQADVSRQNEIAFKDSLAKNADSMQTLTARIANLNIESAEWKNKYVAVRTKYEIVIDSLQHHGHGVAEVIGDTARVRFSGTQSIVAYTGWTLANIRTKESSWDIAITFSEILTQSDLFLDEYDNLWKIRTLSLTPGVNLRGFATIDESILRQIRGVGQTETQNSRFAVGGEFQRDRVYAGFFVRPSNWMFGIQYMLYDNSLKEFQWSDRVKISVYYFIF